MSASVKGYLKTFEFQLLTGSLGPLLKGKRELRAQVASNLLEHIFNWSEATKQSYEDLLASEHCFLSIQVLICILHYF